jgi:uncharacterized protein (TIGR00251 family)
MSTEVVREGPDDHVDVDVIVVPKSSRDEVGKLHGDRLKIHVAAPPVEGAANARLVELLARKLELRKRDVELLRGATGKRKTVRVAGLSVAAVRTRLGLGALAALWLAACEPNTSELGVKILLPEDSSDLEATDNVSLVLAPDGFVETFATDGLDFSIEIEVEPDDVPRDLSVYLAHGEDLLAWGRTPPFFLVGGGDPFAVFVGRPGTISTYPLIVDTPDPEVLAAAARGRGMIVLNADGATFFLDEYTFELQSAEPLSPVPDPADGALVSDALGGVVRVTWNDPPQAWRFDPGLDEWIDLALVNEGVGGREGAAHLVDAPLEHLLLFGGGDATDVVAVDLVPGEDGVLEAAAIEDTVLDGPRPGATATWSTRQETDEGETVVLFGADDSALPTIFLTDPQIALGPEGPWTGGRCVQVDDQAGAADPIRMLCAGGIRGDAPTADALLLRLPPVGSDDPPTSELLSDFLLVPMADALWLVDEEAVYAQGAGRLLRADRSDLAITEATAAVQRATEGQAVTLTTDATVLLGGVDVDDRAVDRWQVFMPAVPE